MALPPVPGVPARPAGLHPSVLAAPPRVPPPGVVRVGFVADVHLGNHAVMGGPREAGINTRARGILDVLRDAVDRAASLGCSALVVAGDLFDDDHPCPQLLAEAAEVLTAWRTLPVVLLVGNHDQRSTAAGDHALGPLAHTAGVRVVDAPTLVTVTPRGSASQGTPPPSTHPATDAYPRLVYLACVPYRREAAASVIAEGVAAVMRGVTPHHPLAVVAHAGVIDGSTPAWLRDAHDALPAETLAAILAGTTREALTDGVRHPLPRGPRIAVVGNWHGHAAWGMPPEDYATTPHPATVPAPLPAGPALVQCGALVPTGFDNPGGAGRYGSLIVWDAPWGAPAQDAPATTPGAVYRVELRGPRFHTLRLSPRDVLAACGGATPEGAARYGSAEGHPAGVVALVAAWLDGLRDPYTSGLYVAVAGPLTDAEGAAVGRALGERVALGAARADAPADAPAGAHDGAAPPCPLLGYRVEAQGRGYVGDALALDGAPLAGGAPGGAADASDASAPDGTAPDAEGAALAHALRGGALDATRGEGLGAITRAYVASMPLPEGVNREYVSAHVARFLGGA